MTKQEEIRQGIEAMIKDAIDKEIFPPLATKVILSYLHSQGVVIKVDRETADFIKCPCDNCTAEHKLIDEWGYFCDLACGQRSYWIARCRGHQDMAGCGFFEPLIKE